MSKLINNAYWYIGVVLYVLFSFYNVTTGNFLLLHLASLVSFVLFGIIVVEISKRRFAFFTKQNLFFIVLGCSLLEIMLYQLLSYYIDGDTFVFSKVDAMLYYTESIKMSKMGFGESFDYLSNHFGFDDWGAFLWIATVFRIIPSQIFLSITHGIVGSISAIMLFDIGRTVMPRRYAFFAALTFSIASFTTILYAACVKETIFVCLIIASFHAFYSFLRCKKVWYLIFTLGWISTILLFRIPVALILLFSFSLTLVLIYSKGLVVAILGIIVSLIICSSSFFAMTFDRYLRGGDVELILERKNELAGDGGIVNQITDPLSALIGPFPSVTMNVVKNTPLSTSGLLYRLLLAFPFFVGVYYAFRYKYRSVYPLIFFFLANALGVAISVKGLEMRLSFPHLPMMYLVAFWCLAKYDYRRMRIKLNRKCVYACVVAVVTICIVWNLRLI